jgi:FAD-dependent oxidoreductase domain-containing protein 1
MVDVVVIGAGVVGCAAALHLKVAAPQLEVLVVEPDYTYARAATGKGTGGVRQLFTRPENIWLSQYTLEVIEDWDRWGAVDGEVAPELGWRRNGYLFVVGEQDLHTLETKAKTSAAGATFVTDRVVDISQDGSVVRSVTLASGQVIPTTAVINTAGVHAPELAAKVGMQIPVEPMRRHEHYIETSANIDHLPFFKDVHGLAVHPYRQGIAVGLVDFDHPGGEDLTLDPTDYPDRVRPALAERFGRLGELTVRESKTSLYDQNRFDGNMIIGNWPGQADNVFVACGFSGHGFMHALGVGRALTELGWHGQYQPLDLSRMGYQRILDGRPYGEEAVR